MPRIPTNNAEPIIDQTTGKFVPPISRTKKSGRAACLAIHSPTKAPMKPTTIDMMQPPLENPTSARPIEPHIPEISSKITISNRDMASPQIINES